MTPVTPSLCPETGGISLGLMHLQGVDAALLGQALQCCPRWMVLLHSHLHLVISNTPSLSLGCREKPGKE